MDTQLKKGLLDYCVLAALAGKDSYGYQIIKDISPYIEVSESTLYPILRRMEEAENVAGYTQEYNNRLRKYFRLTEKGRTYLASFQQEKDQIMGIFDFIEGHSK